MHIHPPLHKNKLVMRECFAMVNNEHSAMTACSLRQW
jgi:hypothetical protein